MHRTCRFCSGTQFKIIVDLGKQPLAGTFLKDKEVGKEKFYPLKVCQCLDCGLVQLLDIVPKEELFQSFLSSVTMKDHFFEYAKEIKERFLNIGDFIVEIGSNDGVLLKPLQDMGMKVLGIEPIAKIAKIAKQKGIPTTVEFFSEKLAKIIKQKADMVLANNVFAHIDDMGDTMRGIDYLLKDDGYFIFEVQFLIDTIEKLQYDTIYHEHLNYYSISSLAPFLKKYGFEIVEVKPIPTHGGSVRVYTKKFKVGLFADKVSETKIKLVTLLLKLRSKNKKVIGYGAAGRANTLLNYCGITADLIEYIVDESPLRYGHFTPGSHIPVIKPSKKDLQVDYIVILAWNYKDHIIEKLKQLRFKGKFIIPLPEVQTI